MASKRPAIPGLAGRIMRTTLVIGVVTVLAAGVVALVSTSRMSSRQLVGRDLMAAQLVDDRLRGRLDSARAGIEQVEGQIESAETSAQLMPVLASVVGTDHAVFQMVVVVDGRGGILGSSEGSVTIGSFKDAPPFIAASDGTRGFFTVQQPDGDWQLWAASAKQGRSSRFLLARLDTEFVSSSLQHAAGDNRSVLIVQDGLVLASAGSFADANLIRARWQADSQHSGRVTLSDPDHGALQGTYVDLTETGELPWRLVVLTPVGIPMQDSVRAVLPSLAVLLVGGAVAMIAAWSVSVRLVRPLRELERAARVAASGSYVRPIAVHGDDEIGRVAEAFNQVSVRLNSLHDLSQLLASASQVDQVLDGILRAMAHLVGPGLAGIYLYDEAQGILLPAKVSGLQSVAPTALTADGDGWLVATLLSGEPRTLDDPEAIRRELPGFMGEYERALAVPLVAGFEPLGVVVALRGSDGHWTEAEREMVKTFSAQAAVAVQTSRLFEHESRSRRVAEALRAVAEELVRPEGGLDNALRRIESVVTELFEAAATSIVVVDRASVALAGPASAADTAVLAVALRAFEKQPSGARPMIVPRGVDDRADELLSDSGSEQLLIVPVAFDTDHGAVMVIAGDRTLGIGESVQVAGAVADELALALDNAYFYERALSRAANLETIFRISQAVGSSLQVNVVLNRVLDVVQKILSADAVALLEFDARRKSLTTAMARGDIPPSLLSMELMPGDDVPGHVFASGQPATLRDMHPGMHGIAGDAAANDLHSMLAVPLLARGRPIGVLMVFSADPASFTQEDAGMLQTFATQAALAIDTARLYSREHDVATVLQQSILPAALPEYQEVEAGSVYAPAGVDAEIGGDYYDLFKDPSGDIWFAIADVCGKGVHAATRTSMIKYALRAFASAGMSPAQVLSGLNRMISESGTPSDIVTVWVGRLDRDATRLTWANGGHPQGLLRHSDGTITLLEVTGPLLGAMPEVPFDEMCVNVTAGERILLYTDGVTEARSGNIFFGEQRVRDCFVGDGASSEIAADLLSSVRRFVRADLRDDVAVLVLSLRDRGSESL